MQKKHFFAYLFLLSFICLPQGAFSQEIRENERGEKIIVYPDGRMEYFNGEPVEPGTGTTTTGYPVFQGRIEPLEGNIAVNEADLFKIAQRRSQLSGVAAQLALERVSEAENNLNRIQRQWESATDEQQKAALKKQLDTAVRTLQNSRKLAGESQVAAKSDAEMLKKGGYIDAYNERQQLRQNNDAANTALRTTSASVSIDNLPLMENTVATQYEDLMRRPPAASCTFAFEGDDPDKGQYRRDHRAELLFTYTDERLRPHLGSREYLTCDAFLSSLGGYRFLTLNFTFAFPNAQEAYGFIDEKSLLTIKLLNGNYINLRAGTLDRGKYNTVTQTLTYSVYYPIDRSYISLLRASEIDLLRVFWSSGFEEYPIHQMDLFMRQFRCLGD